MAGGVRCVTDVVGHKPENIPAPEKKAKSDRLPPSPPRPAPSPKESPRKQDETDAADVMTLYLGEISRIPLLSRREEKHLARLVQRGRKARRRLERARPLGAEEQARLDRLARLGDWARSELISANSRLVVSIAKRYSGLGVSLADLVQEGNIGLIRAVEKYDYRRGYRLSTYATWWIRQAITRALAEQGRMVRLPVHACERLSRVIRTIQKLRQELGREPDLAEVAATVGLPADKVAALLDQAQQPLSLDMPIGQGSEGCLADLVEDDSSRLPSEATWTSLLRQQMREVLASLSAREDRVLQMRYGLRDGHAYTLGEVGTRFGLTRERIRQIEVQALGKLRQEPRSRKLQDYLA
jgi:RNA polymerase primary sigma factor